MSPVPKKIVLFIVEGPTDRDALDAALKRLYPDIRFMVMHGDFTADYNYSHSSLLAGLGSMIKKELARYGTKSSDLELYPPADSFARQIFQFPSGSEIDHPFGAARMKILGSFSNFAK